jgi:hypothetical protein
MAQYVCACRIKLQRCGCVVAAIDTSRCCQHWGVGMPSADLGMSALGCGHVSMSAFGYSCQHRGACVTSADEGIHCLCVAAGLAPPLKAWRTLAS